jgi:hypothetical protein
MNTVQDVMRENFTPEAIALMIAYLQGATCLRDPGAETSVKAFVECLTELVGGPDAVNALFEEIWV